MLTMYTVCGYSVVALTSMIEHKHIHVSYFIENLVCLVQGTQINYNGTPLYHTFYDNKMKRCLPAMGQSTYIFVYLHFT